MLWRILESGEILLLFALFSATGLVRFPFAVENVAKEIPDQEGENE